jgi:hypothetical protein
MSLYVADKKTNLLQKTERKNIEKYPFEFKPPSWTSR